MPLEEEPLASKATTAVSATGDPTPLAPPPRTQKQEQGELEGPGMGGLSTDVRTRILRREDEIDGVARLCAAVFKEVAGGEGGGLRAYTSPSTLVNVPVSARTTPR